MPRPSLELNNPRPLVVPRRMRSSPRSLAAVAGLSLLCGVGCIHTPARVDYVIEGRVVDAVTGAPLPGVEVHAHWPARMPQRPGSSLFTTVRTGPLGRFWFSKSVLRPATKCVCLGCGRPLSVKEGNAIGTAITVSCPRCTATSAGLGKGTMDFLSHGQGGSPQIMRSVPRPAAELKARQNGTSTVRYKLPDIPVETTGSQAYPEQYQPPRDEGYDPGADQPPAQ